MPLLKKAKSHNTEAFSCQQKNGTAAAALSQLLSSFQEYLQGPLGQLLSQLKAKPVPVEPHHRDLPTNYVSIL